MVMEDDSNCQQCGKPFSMNIYCAECIEKYTRQIRNSAIDEAIAEIDRLEIYDDNKGIRKGIVNTTKLKSALIAMKKETK